MGRGEPLAGHIVAVMDYQAIDEESEEEPWRVQAQRLRQMITSAFTYTGAYAVLIMSGLKHVPGHGLSPCKWSAASRGLELLD